MRKTTIIPTVLMICMSLILGCSNEPDIIISAVESTGTIYGRVYHNSAPVSVTLYKDLQVYATTKTDPAEGSFIFREIPYDYYTLTASVGSWFAKRYIELERPLDRTTLSLKDTSRIVSYFDWDYGGTVVTVTAMKNYTESVIPLLLNSYRRFSDSGAPVLFVDTTLAYTDSVNSTHNKVFITISNEDLFARDSIRAYIPYRSCVDSDSCTEDTAHITLHIDSTGYSEAIIKKIIITDGLTVPQRLSREDSISVVFSGTMNRKSVEDHFYIYSTKNPEDTIPCSLFWRDNMVTCIPANPWESLTSYTLVIGRGAMTQDSLVLPDDFTMALQTGAEDFFFSYWPLDGTTGVNTEASLIFNANYSLDPDLFRQAFDIEPSVDSLIFSLTKSNSIQVSHAPFAAGTEYQITIDSSLTSRKGITLGATLNSTFTTKE